jgi:hypothetical protein
MGEKSRGNHPTGGWCKYRATCVNYVRGLCGKCFRYSKLKKKDIHEQSNRSKSEKGKGAPQTGAIDHPEEG